MYLFLLVVQTVILIILMVQDFKHREVSVMAVLGALLCSLAVSGINIGWPFWKYTLANCCIAAIVLLGTGAYVKIRHRKKTFQSFMGLGDILFIVAISPLFTPYNFVLFLVVSWIVTILIYALYIQLAAKNWQYKIPLISTMSLTLMGVFVFELLTHNAALRYSVPPFLTTLYGV